MKQLPRHTIRQLTLRGLPLDLQDRVRALAQRDQLSLNQAVIQLARSGAGLDQSASTDVIGDSLDRFIGTWSAKEVRLMARASQLLDEMDALTR